MDINTSSSEAHVGNKKEAGSKQQKMTATQPSVDKVTAHTTKTTKPGGPSHKGTKYHGPRCDDGDRTITT